MTAYRRWCHNRTSRTASKPSARRPYRKGYDMSDTIYLTAADDIEPTDQGFAIVSVGGGTRVELTDLLAERFVINVLGSQRRQARVIEGAS